MKWTNKGHEYDEIAKVILDESPEYYIWGAAISGRACYKFFKKEINIVGFIDSKPKNKVKKLEMWKYTTLQFWTTVEKIPVFWSPLFTVRQFFNH